MMWGYGYNGSGMFAWMIISSVIWLVLVGIAVWALVRWVTARSAASSSPPPSGTAGPSAHEILRQRYVRGEIDEPTFERMQADLDASIANEAKHEMVAGGRRPE